MSTLLDGTGHPARFGYVRCSECDCWRRDTGLEVVRMPGFSPRCFDAYLCRRLRESRDGGPYLPHAGSPTTDDKAPSSLATLKTGIDPHGDAV